MKNLSLTILLMITAISFSAQGNDKKRDKPYSAKEMTAEERETMAARHEKLAGCLRSGKPMGECKDEMMGVEDCRMMGKMHSRSKMDGNEKHRDK